MKLVYWYCPQDTDHRCYNIRAKTRKEAKAILDAAWNKDSYGEPRKMVVEYQDGFDLMIKCMSEGSLSEDFE